MRTNLQKNVLGRENKAQEKAYGKVQRRVLVFFLAIDISRD
jgi:hypothetical protein